MKIAATHPGKHGDALYTLPTIRALAAEHGKIDFYTSSYCEPLRSLFEAQECIGGFYVAPNYRIERMDMGVQPRYVPVDASLYDYVFQLGFDRVPDCAIPDFIARELNVNPAPIQYDVPDKERIWKDYIVLAPRASDDYTPLFQEIIDGAALDCMIVGGHGDGAKLHGGVDYTETDYLNTAWLIKHAKAFVGLMSSQLVLANGFPIPRICPHDGKSWDMRHVVRSEYNHYLVKPSASEVWEIINAV